MEYQGRWPVYLSAAGCFRDVWSQLVIDDERWTGIRMQIRTPAFCAVVLIAGLVCLARGSGYFRATRTILSTLPYQNGPRLAVVSRTGRLEAIRNGIPKELAASWLRDSKLLEAMGTCSLSHLSKAIYRQTSVGRFLHAG